MKETKRGGYRPNSGAKPKPPAEVASVRIVANLTPAEAAEWQRRGRTGWLREELRKLAVPDSQ
jgi:hypothetical protein